MIYLDKAATTQPYQEVIDVMVDVMQNHWGNPSAPYAFADDAKNIIESVRMQIAEDINANPEEVIFTSGACESNNLAIHGYIRANGARWWTTRMEHTSIDEMIYKVSPYTFFLENDNMGFVEFPQSMIQTMREFYSTCKPLISVGAANGEIGAIQDLKYISTMAHDLGCVFHTDATQLFPERRIDVQKMGIDMMSVSAQKFNGPRGAGFLYVRNGIKLKPLIYGSQENGLRAGTYDTAAIAGMGEALKLTRHFNNIYRGSAVFVEELRNKLLNKLLQIPGTTLNGPPVEGDRIVNNINLTIDGVDAEQLVTLCSLNELYIGKGSACQSYDKKPSHVLKAIGLTDEQAFNTIRITVGADNLHEEIDQAANIITKLIERIRGDE